MGSYNLHCSVSHCSIHTGDKAAMVPLKIKKDGFADPGLQFEQPFQSYPAILGVYNDYGRLAHVTVPEYYKHWEAGVSFPRFAAGDVTSLPSGWHVTYLRGEVYELLSSPMPNECGRVQDSLHGGDISAGILVKLGFVQTHKFDDGRRYNLRFEHPLVTTHYIMSDGGWINIHNATTNLAENNKPYHPDELIALFPQISAEPLRGLTPVHFRVADAMRGIDSAIQLNSTLVKLGSTPAVNLSSLIEHSERKLRLDGVLSALAPEHLQSAEEDIVTLVIFQQNLFCNGILLAPGIHGLQFGNPYGAMVLAKTILAMATEDADYEEDE